MHILVFQPKHLSQRTPLLTHAHLGVPVEAGAAFTAVAIRMVNALRQRVVASVTLAVDAFVQLLAARCWKERETVKSVIAVRLRFVVFILNLPLPTRLLTADVQLFVWCKFHERFIQTPRTCWMYII